MYKEANCFLIIAKSTAFVIIIKDGGDGSRKKGKRVHVIHTMMLICYMNRHYFRRKTP